MMHLFQCDNIKAGVGVFVLVVNGSATLYGIMKVNHRGNDFMSLPFASGLSQMYCKAHPYKIHTN